MKHIRYSYTKVLGYEGLAFQGERPSTQPPLQSGDQLFGPPIWIKHVVETLMLKDRQFVLGVVILAAEPITEEFVYKVIDRVTAHAQKEPLLKVL